MLYVQKLNDKAKLPTIGHPGEDLGYDLYATEGCVIYSHDVAKIPTGIAATFIRWPAKYGLLIRDRSSMAGRGAFVVSGVMDAGYRGEIFVMLRYDAHETIDGGYAPPMVIKAGDKVAQMIPIRVLADEVEHVESLDQFASARGADGFGSTGR